MLKAQDDGNMLAQHSSSTRGLKQHDPESPESRAQFLPSLLGGGEATLTDTQSSAQGLQVERPRDTEGNGKVGAGQELMQRPDGASTRKVHSDLYTACC